MTRDMTRREFHAALRRRGWWKGLLGIEISYKTTVGMVMIRTARGIKVNRRASLAKAIRESGEAV